MICANKHFRGKNRCTVGFSSNHTMDILEPKVIELLGRREKFFRSVGDKRIKTALGHLTKIKAEIDVPCTIRDGTRTVRASALPLLTLPFIL